MQAIGLIALWALLFVSLGRFQEIFPVLIPLQLGKLSIAFGLAAVMAINAKDLTLFITKTPLKKYLYALLLIGFFSIPFSIYISDAFDKYMGFLRTFLIASIIVALGKKHLSNVKLCICVIVLILSTQMILQKAIGRSSVSLTYDPNDIAFLFVLFLPFIIHGIGSKNVIIKIVYLITSGSAVASIALSGSRGGLLALVSIALYSIILAKKRRFLYICLCFMGAVIFSQMASDEFWQRIQALIDGTDYNLAETGDSRVAIWTSAIELMFRRPLFGVGIGQFTTAMGTLAEGAWRTAHNSFIQIGLELGFGGLFAFCGIFISFFRLSKQGEKAPFLSAQSQALYRSLRISILAFCVGGFFISHAYTPITYSFISFGAIMFLEYQRQERYAFEKAEELDSDTQESPNKTDDRLNTTKDAHHATLQTTDKKHAQNQKNNIDTLVQYAEKQTPDAYIKKESTKFVKLIEAEQKRQRKKERLQNGDKLKKIPKE